MPYFFQLFFIFKDWNIETINRVKQSFVEGCEIPVDEIINHPKYDMMILQCYGCPSKDFLKGLIESFKTLKKIDVKKFKKVGEYDIKVKL